MASSVKLSEIVPSRFVHLTPPDEANIERIRADLESGSKMLLNVPHVFKNEHGKYELLAGHDRTEAARRAGWEKIDVRDFSGAVNTDDAILAHFCRENLLRKEISKAAIAGEWLRKHPEWTDVRLAVESGCSNEYVGQVRADLIAKGLLQVVEVRTRADGSERKYKPRAERKPRTTPAQPKSKDEAPEDAAAAIIAAADAKRAQQNPTPPSAQGGAPKRPSDAPGEVEQQGAPESESLPSGGDEGSPENMGSGPGTDPAVPAVGGVVDSEPKSTEAVRGDGGGSAEPVAIRRAPTAFAVRDAIRERGVILLDPTDEDRAGLTAADREWFRSVSRWAQLWSAACPAEKSAAASARNAVTITESRICEI